MAEDLKRLAAQLADPDEVRRSAFQIVQKLSAFVTDREIESDDDRRVHDLVLRALDQRDCFGEWARIVDALARQRGLFPYLPADELSFADLLACEMHRPEGFEEVVFHRAQGEVYRLLMAGENVILSAPTSFGKSLIVDALVASGHYANIVVVVPTIALIDETRRRLIERFRHGYKVITHLGQARADRNIYVLTQERVVDFPELNGVDLFVIDEFYKLDPRRDPDRAYLLNQAFYRLYSGKAQFYLLGPNIRQLPLELPPRFRFKFVATDYSTVVSEVVRVGAGAAERQDALLDLCRKLDEPTIIYCASPASARRVAAALEVAKIGRADPSVAGAAAWIGKEYHPDWALVRALRLGIGLHHGRVPRALQQYLVRAFNSGMLRFLVCTSTLIEGVNTKAKNVIIYDNKVATRKFDFFTFNNIKGRSGRMREHFVGRVFLFNDPPQEELPILDIPMLTQSEDVPESLLIQLERDDLTARSRERVEWVYKQQVLSTETLRGNRGIEPKAQIALASQIIENPEYYEPLLRWSGMPSYEQLRAVSELIWEYLIPDERRRAGVSSGKQLAWKINRFRNTRSIHRLILEELAQQGEPDADAAVEDTLEFVRFWPTFNFPRLLMALDRIQREVLGARGRPTGDYAAFATSIENYFVPAGIAALDEYGVPLQIAMRIASSLDDVEDLDAVLLSLRSLDVGSVKLGEFERELVLDAQKFV